MLLFSNVLNISEKMTKEAFIGLVLEWNQGSADSHPENSVTGIEWKGERNIRYGDDLLWLDIQEYRNENIIAVRHEKTAADGAVWDTDFVMNFNEMKMSVRLDRSYLEEAVILNAEFSTPHIITLLIEHDYLVPDGTQPICRTPIGITEQNMDKIADVINGKNSYALPVVYVSKTRDDEFPVNVKLLASKLKGVAHVFMQISKGSNYCLREKCESRNEYYGAVGIYYPNSAIRRRRYLYHSEIGWDDVLMGKVIRDVIQYSNSKMIDPLYTWQGVNNALLRDRLAAQRQERLAAELASRLSQYQALSQILQEKEKFQEKLTSLNALLEEKDESIDFLNQYSQELEQETTELTKKNDALERENEWLKSRLSNVTDIPVLYMGGENDFYEGEIKDLILAALSDALKGKGIPEESRRADVVIDIIENNDYKRSSEQKAEEVKRVMKGYKGMTAPVRKGLSNLGFTSITADGPHYKIQYYEDGRYVVSIAKTPSDGRSGQNNASTIIKEVF